MKAEVYQPYNSLDALARKGIVLPKPRDEWRLVSKPLVGEITGIASIRGFTIATNGLLVLVENEIGAWWFAHLDYFIPDEVELDSDLYNEARVKKPTKHERMFREFL